MSDVREASARTPPDAGIRAGAVGVDRDNPWPGLTPFTENLSAFFFGRDQEAAELFRLVRRETLTLLFGQSGLGKSSLLQAGLAPRLRQADFIPVNIRLDHAVDAPPLVDQVKTAIRQVIDARQVDAPQPRPDQTLWEYFHGKDADFWTPKHRLATPVLIFDQFEEIFTLGRASEAARARGDAFLHQLGDLIENRIPEDLKKKLDDGAIEPNQFSFGDAWCKVLITFREDYLPDLEGLRLQIRSVMQNRMRIVRMNGTQALDVVVKAGGELVEPGVGPLVVQFVAAAGADGAAVPLERLAAMEVEPALLSVVCRELNNKRIRLGQPRITADLLAGSRREILSDFYHRSIEDLPESVRIFVEDRLLTPSGIRDNIALENALLEPGITREMIERLVARRLLRVEDRLGVSRVELTHDILAQPIRASRDTRQQRLALEKAAARERAARERLAQVRRRVALYISLAGVLITLPLAGIALWQKSTAMHALEEAKTESDLAVKNGTLAANNLELAGKNLQLAKDRLADYYALRIQGAMQDSPPDPLVGEMLLHQAERESTFHHADLVRVLLPAAPFLPERNVTLGFPIDRLLYSPDGAVLAAFGNGHVRFIDAGTGSPLPPADFDYALGDAHVMSVAFHPHAPILAVHIAEPDGSDSVLRWNCATHTEVIPRLRLIWPRIPTSSKDDVAADVDGTTSPPPTPAQAPRAVAAKSPAHPAALPLMYSFDGTMLIAVGPNGDLALIPLVTSASPPPTTEPARRAVALPVAPAKYLLHWEIEPQLRKSGSRARQSAPRGSTSAGNADGRDAAAARGFVPTALAYAQYGQVILAADSTDLLFLDRDSLAIIDARPLETDPHVQPDEARLAASPGGRSFCTWPGGSDNENSCQLQATSDGWKSAETIDPRLIPLSSRPLTAAYSMDGRFVAIGLRGNTIEICGNNRREAIQVLRQQGAIRALAFRPDGLGLASASDNGQLQFWRVSERELHPANHAGGYADPVAVSPNGAAIASLDRVDDEDRCVRVVKAATGDVLGTWSLPWGQVAAIVLRDDLHPIAAIAKRDALEIRDLQTGSTLAKITGTGEIATARFSDDEKLIGIESVSGAISIFDTTTLAKISGAASRAQPAGISLPARSHANESDDTTPTDWFATIAFSHGGAQLAHYSAASNSIDIFDVRTGTPTGTSFLVPGTTSISSLEYSGDNNDLLCGDLSGNLLVLDAGSGRRILGVRHASKTIAQISISRDNAILVHNGPAGGLLFLKAANVSDIDVLHRDSGLMLDSNIDVALAPVAERQKQLAALRISARSAGRAEFWSAYWKWQWGITALESDPSQPLTRENLNAVAAPMANFLAAHPHDDDLPEEIVYSREDLRRLQPIEPNPTAEQIEAKVTVAEDFNFSTRTVLLDEVFSAVPANSPQRGIVAAMLACAIAHHVEHLNWPPSEQKEKEIQSARAFGVASEAIRLGYKDYDTLRKAFGKLVRDPRFPTDALKTDELINDGYTAFRQGSFDAALHYFTTVKARDPANYDAWYGQGLALGGLGTYSEAIECHRHAITLTKEPRELGNAYGGIAWNLSNQWPPKLDEAFAAAQQAVQAAPQLAYAYTMRGWISFQSRSYVNALNDYSAALRLAPNSSRYLQERAQIYLETGDIPSALIDLKQSISGLETDVSAYLRPGDLLNQYGRYEEALRYYNQGLEAAARANPVSQTTIVNYRRARAWTELNMGNYPGAHADLDAIRRNSWGQANYQRALGTLALAEGYPKAALEAFNHAILLAAPDPWLLTFRAQTELRLNDPAAAKLDLQRAMSSDSYATWNAIVAALDAICDCDLTVLAAQRLDSAIKLVPLVPSYAVARGEIALRAGNQEEASRYFEMADAIPLPLHQPINELPRGIARAYLGKYQLAATDVTDVSNFDAGNPHRDYGKVVVLLMHSTSGSSARDAAQVMWYLIAAAWGKGTDGYALSHDWRLRSLFADPEFKSIVAAQDIPADQPLRFLQLARVLVRLDKRNKQNSAGTNTTDLFLSGAIAELKRAVVFGQDLDAIDSDPEFAVLRPFPQYQQLLHSRNTGPTTAP